MNIKVVIVWAFVVVIFAGIGIFGYVNQDLLLIQDNDVYVPKTEDNTEAKKCIATLATGQSDYRFTIKDDQIQKVVIGYNASQENIENYEAATNINRIINEQKVQGVTAILYGGVSDFVLSLTVTVNNYDKATIESLREDFNKLSILIDSINDYSSYQTAISNLGNAYTCE